MIRTAMTAEFAGTLSPVTLCTWDNYQYRRCGTDASIRLPVSGEA
jgi:hypothetical protein